MISAVEICSQSLVKCGMPAISSFDDGTLEAKTAKILYETIVRSILLESDWNFAVRIEVINGSVDTEGLSRYRFPLSLPVLKILSVANGNGSRNLDFKLIENEVLSDRDNLEIHYIARIPESEFPIYFIKVVVDHLASEFSLALSENLSKSDFFYQKAQRELAVARSIESRFDPDRSIRDFPLINVRNQ
jgi:hypothetical protein